MTKNVGYNNISHNEGVGYWLFSFFVITTTIIGGGYTANIFPCLHLHYFLSQLFDISRSA